VVALVVMALWRLIETILGRSTDPKSQGASSEVLDRVKAFALAVVYLAFAYSTFGFARGAGKSTGEQNSGISDQRTPDADRRPIHQNVRGSGGLSLLADPEPRPSPGRQTIPP
jgi:hypothetical protein